MGRPSATEAAAQKLVTEIKALAKKERIALEGLQEADAKRSDPLQLGKAVGDLTRNNEELRIKTEQLRSLAESGDLADAQLQDECSRLLKQRDKDAIDSPIPALRGKIALRVTDALVSRSRAGRGAADSGDGGSHPRGEVPTSEPASNIHSATPIEHHDVLLVAPAGVHSPEQFYRFPVVKTAPSRASRGASDTEDPTSDADGPERKGQYRDKPELLDAFDYGQRRALSFARPQDWGPASVRATQRGPAFSTLPLKPEPNSAAGGVSDSSQCYLIDTQNLNFRNAWTAEEWNDTPGGVDLPPAQGASKNELEALLAGPQGKVFRLVLTHIVDWAPRTQARIVGTLSNGAGEVELGTVESVDLRPQMEVWHQLRGGTAMGRVYFDDAHGGRVIPLVNITTLTRD